MLLRRPTLFAQDPELLCTFLVHIAAAASHAVPELVRKGRYSPSHSTSASALLDASHKDPECEPLRFKQPDKAFGDAYEHVAARDAATDAVRDGMIRSQFAALHTAFHSVRPTSRAAALAETHSPCLIPQRSIIRMHSPGHFCFLL